MWRFIVLASFAAVLSAETVSGNIIVKRRLTKLRVTPTVAMYNRGVAGPLESAARVDPLKYERNHVVIWLEGETPGLPRDAVITQQGRQFLPDLAVVPAGSSVAFPNMDPIFHNVFSFSKIRSFDLGNYPVGESRTVKFSKPGVVYVNCHLHSNMSGTIVVTPNQWFARPNPAGPYSIAEVPPGAYTVTAWHRTAGIFQKKVQVLPGKGAQVDFLIPLGDPE
jgi:plastocyanin